MLTSLRTLQRPSFRFQIFFYLYYKRLIQKLKCITKARKKVEEQII